MAIKITCGKCSKRISIDEAFAGGVCRCPYCTTINDVPLHPGQGPAVTASKTPKRIPVAKKASLQGLAAVLIFLVLLGIIISVVVTIVVVSRGGDSGTPQPPEVVEGPQNPFEACPPGFVAGTLRIESPVVYCLDGDASMASYFRYAARMTRVSVDALAEGDSAQVLLIGRLPTESIVIDGGQGAGALEAALAGFQPGTGEDINSVIERAIDMGPATVVIITRRPVDRLWGNIAAREGVKLVTVGVAAPAAVEERLRSIATESGGQSRIFSAMDLSHYFKQVD